MTSPTDLGPTFNDLPHRSPSTLPTENCLDVDVGLHPATAIDPKKNINKKVELLLGRGDDSHINRILCQAKKCAEKRLWRWDDSQRTNKRDVFASIHARFFYKAYYKFRVPWLVEIDLEHIIAVSTRDKLQLPSCELYTLMNDLLDPVQKIFAFHVACLPIPPPPLLSGTRKKSVD